MGAWLADPVKVHAALNQKICNIQDDYGYDIGTVALDDADHNPTADTTPVGAVLNGTLDFGPDGRAGAPSWKRCIGFQPLFFGCFSCAAMQPLNATPLFFPLLGLRMILNKNTKTLPKSISYGVEVGGKIKGLH